MNSTAELGLVRAQAVIRGHLSRVGINGARIRAAKKAREAAKLEGAEAPPSPFLPTPHSVVSEMLRVCGVNASTVALDIGCGDARVPLAAVRAGARAGIGIESLDGVFEKARQNVRDAGLSDRVDLFHSDFTSPSNRSLVADCLDRANLVFVFLLPSDMSLIVSLVLQAIKRRMQRHRDAGGAAMDGVDSHAAAAAAASVVPASSAVPAIDAAAFPVASCPCPASLRIRVASWTFSLSSSGVEAEALLALPLRPAHSVQIESAHTRLHLYDLCACSIYDHSHDYEAAAAAVAEEEGHAARISRDFSAASPSHVATPPGGPSDLSAGGAIDVSSIPWGHALNSSALLRARWAQVAPRGLFVEADLRIKPSAIARAAASSVSVGPAVAASSVSAPAAAAASSMSAAATPAAAAAAPFTIDDVCFAHDAGVEGESFLDWYSTLLSLQSSQQPEGSGSGSGSGAAAKRALGLKLDFKCAEGVGPVLAYLRSIADSASAAAPAPLASLHSLWFNADVLPGPGFPASAAATVDGAQFLRQCSRAFPGAVLSVGWVTRSVVGGEAWSVEDEPAQHQQQYYTHAHISSMLALLHSVASVAHQCTFPLRASLVAASWSRGTIQRLLTCCPWATLTIWTSRAEQQRAGAAEEEQWIARTLPRERTFVDLVLD